MVLIPRCSLVWNNIGLLNNFWLFLFRNYFLGDLIFRVGGPKVGFYGSHIGSDAVYESTQSGVTWLDFLSCDTGLHIQDFQYSLHAMHRRCCGLRWWGTETISFYIYMSTCTTLYQGTDGPTSSNLQNKHLCALTLSFSVILQKLLQCSKIYFFLIYLGLCAWFT